MNQGIHDTTAYLGRDSHGTNDNMTATHANIRHWTSRVEGLGHNISKDNFFSSPRFLITLADIK